MATSTRRTSGPVLRSVSPSPSHSGRFYSYRTPSSAFASSSATAFSARTSSSSSGALLRRPTSPTRVSLYNPAPSVRFSLLDRPSSPNRSVSVTNRSTPVVQSPQSQKRTCMCSPTNHPGSFRCSLHKGSGNSNGHTSSYSSNSNRLNMRRSAMKNSLVRIGTVEGGDWVKRALASLIRPSSHQQRRRDDFKPRPSRLSAMSKA